MFLDNFFQYLATNGLPVCNGLSFEQQDRAQYWAMHPDELRAIQHYYDTANNFNKNKYEAYLNER